MTRPDDNSDMIEVERRCFVATDNAMHAWAAFSLARSAKTAPPEWVMRYFDLCAGNLRRLSAGTPISGGKGLGPKIAQCLKLEGKGSRSPLEMYHSDWMLFGLNVRALIHDGDKEDFAVEHVAEAAGVSASKVRRGWKLYDSLFPGANCLPDEIVNAELSSGSSGDESGQ